MEINLSAYSLDFTTCLNKVEHSSDDELTKAYQSRLEKEAYKDFTKKDWMTYWIQKAKEHGVKYVIGNQLKEYAVFKSLKSKFKPAEIKAMIDFLWDSDQDMFMKSSMGVLVLRSDCINGIYQNSQDWIFGRYRTRAQWKKERSKPVKRNREWTGEVMEATEHKQINSVVTL